MREPQHPLTYFIWAVLIASAVAAVVLGRWGVVFVSLATLLLTLLPLAVERWARLRFPRGFVAAVVFFIAGTLFFGEVFDFYERFAWWDILLHTGSAVGFGMIGTVLVLYILQGDRLRASPVLAALLAFSFAVSIGAVWEIFEFSMDRVFGTNMQKSGLVDTMGDLIVDCLGAGVGALAGYRYLKGRAEGRLAGTIGAFVEDNLEEREGR